MMMMMMKKKKKKTLNFLLASHFFVFFARREYDKFRDEPTKKKKKKNETTKKTSSSSPAYVRFSQSLFKGCVFFCVVCCLCARVNNVAPKECGVGSYKKPKENEQQSVCYSHYCVFGLFVRFGKI